MATTIANPTDLNLGASAGSNSVPQLEAPKPSGQRQNLSLGNTAERSLAVGGGFSNIMSQPAVQKAMPTIIVMMAVGLFLLAFSWIQTPPYKTVYPGLSEADRQAAYTLSLIHI